MVERQGVQSDTTLETHAERLRERDVTDNAVVERYEDGLEEVDFDVDYDELDSEEVYVVPMVAAGASGTKQVISSVATAVAKSARIVVISLSEQPVSWRRTANALRGVAVRSFSQDSSLGSTGV